MAFRHFHQRSGPFHELSDQRRFSVERSTTGGGYTTGYSTGYSTSYTSSYTTSHTTQSSFSFNISIPLGPITLGPFKVPVNLQILSKLLPATVKITPWRLLNTVFVLWVGIGKAVSMHQGQSIVPSTLEWIMGVIWASISYWLYLIGTQHPNTLSWFFQNDLNEQNKLFKLFGLLLHSSFVPFAIRTSTLVAITMDLEVPLLVLLAIATSIGLTMDGLQLIWCLLMKLIISEHAMHVGHWMMDLITHSHWDPKQSSMALYMTFHMLNFFVVGFLAILATQHPWGISGVFNSLYNHPPTSLLGFSQAFVYILSSSLTLMLIKKISHGIAYITIGFMTNDDF